MTLRTIGHGTASADRLTELLHGAGVQQLVDVRTAPGSRRNPEMVREEMARWLPERGIGYRWERRLGGWRRDPPDSPDTALRNRSFGGYAAHMRTPEFRTAVEELLAGSARTAVLCSEAVWWRCHRRLIADFALLVRDVAVEHLMHDGRRTGHRPTDGVRLREDGLLVYDGG
ncbi:MAG TPA: DUF488 domain-containing protein [Pseudonocardia sp.]|nr:DUF488 domain-containing protein [Pseudonocardia sp.]